MEKKIVLEVRKPREAHIGDVDSGDRPERKSNRKCPDCAGRGYGRDCGGAVMGVPVLILGESGSGKSTSLRNFKPDEYLLLNVAGKPLPFRGRPKYQINKPDYVTMTKAISTSPTKVVVIDDSQYAMAF